MDRRSKSCLFRPRQGGGVSGALEIASLELRGEIASKEGKHDKAVHFLEQAVTKQRDLGYMEPPLYSRPLTETMGYALIAAGRFDEARQSFQKALAERPNSGHPLLGIARTYAAQADRAGASKAYAAFLKAWSNADLDLPEIAEARSWASQSMSGTFQVRGAPKK